MASTVTPSLVRTGSGVPLSRSTSKISLKRKSSSGVHGTDGIVVEECSICLDVVSLPLRLACSHLFCFLCVKGHSLFGLNSSCPLCRAPIRQKDLQNASVNVQSITSKQGFVWKYKGGYKWWLYDERSNEQVEKLYTEYQKYREELEEVRQKNIANGYNPDYNDLTEGSDKGSNGGNHSDCEQDNDDDESDDGNNSDSKIDENEDSEHSDDSSFEDLANVQPNIASASDSKPISLVAAADQPEPQNNNVKQLVPPFTPLPIVPKFILRIGAKNYTLDFFNMYQYQEGNLSSRRSIARIAREDIPNDSSLIGQAGVKFAK